MTSAGNGNTWQLPQGIPGGGLQPLSEHVLQFERQVSALKDSQHLLLASIQDVIGELERVQGNLPAEDLAQRVLRLSDLQKRASQLSTLLTTVEARLSRIQAHIEQQKAAALQAEEDGPPVA